MSLPCGAVVRFVIVTFPFHTHLFMTMLLHWLSLDLENTQ